jgi:Flp pilus assembly protein TadB
VKRSAQRPVVITDAERSQDDQLRAREIRYVIMMGLRLVCVVVAGVLVGLKVPLLPLWLSLCVAGAVLLPWLAVILANDRPPKEEHRLSHRLHRATEAPPPPRSVGSAEEPKVIDADQ